MGHRSTPSSSEVIAMMRLFADVVALRGDPAMQRKLLIDGLNERLGTTQGFFYVGDDWRPGKGARFVHSTLTAVVDPFFGRYAAEFGGRTPLAADAFCDRSVRDPRRVPVLTLAGVLPDAEAARQYPDFADGVQTLRMRDAVIGFYRLPGTDRMAGIGLHVLGGRGKLGDRRLALARFAVVELGRLIERGYVAMPPANGSRALPERLAEVLNRLLTGEHPKRIAHRLGLSVWTVREHIQRIYRHYGVSGRDELMARFILSRPANHL
jgi:DNA-binding CsgD family transcriptional regulator